MATTTHKGWTLIPQGTRPYTTEFNALIGEIDDTAHATDTNVTANSNAILAAGYGDNAGKLKRVDTDAWEAPQTGVVYYAPLSSYIKRAGIAAGKLRRLHFGATNDGVTVVASGVVALVDQHIDSRDANPNPDRNVPGGGPVAASSAYVFCYHEVGAGTIKSRVAGTFVLDGGWIEYTVA